MTKAISSITLTTPIADSPRSAIIWVADFNISTPRTIATSYLPSRTRTAASFVEHLLRGRPRFAANFGGWIRIPLPVSTEPARGSHRDRHHETGSHKPNGRVPARRISVRAMTLDLCSHYIFGLLSERESSTFLPRGGTAAHQSASLLRCYTPDLVRILYPNAGWAICLPGAAAGGRSHCAVGLGGQRHPPARRPSAAVAARLGSRRRSRGDRRCRGVPDVFPSKVPCRTRTGGLRQHPQLFLLSGGLLVLRARRTK